MKRQKEQQRRTNRLGVPVSPLGQYDQFGEVRRQLSVARTLFGSTATIKACRICE
jgi:hypothetical protein